MTVGQAVGYLQRGGLKIWFLGYDPCKWFKDDWRSKGMEWINDNEVKYDIILLLPATSENIWIGVWYRLATWTGER